VSAFNQAAFAAAIAAVISARGLTDRAAAREIGVSPSTVTRSVRHDKRPDVDSLCLMVDWAGLSLDVFAVRQRPIPEMPSVADQRRIVAAQRAAESASQALASLLGMEAR
jgi:transcriptional regulator with XRE-family HTH domain